MTLCAPLIPAIRERTQASVRTKRIPESGTLEHARFCRKGLRAALVTAATGHLQRKPRHRALMRPLVRVPSCQLTHACAAPRTFTPYEANHRMRGQAHWLRIRACADVRAFSSLSSALRLPLPRRAGNPSVRFPCRQLARKETRLRLSTDVRSV